MSPAITRAAPVRKSNLRQIALPTEHGSWGFLLEPIAAGLAIAFSAAGIYVVLAVVGAFLARRPFQILVMQQRVRSASTPAFKFLAAYSLIALAGFTGLIVTTGAASLVPFAIALPIAVFQLYTEITQRGRQLTAELTGAVIMPSSAAAMILAAGGTWLQAGTIWFFFIARFVPSILYVRNRLNLEKGKQSSFYIPAVLHLGALIVVAWLAITDYFPLLTIPAFALLMARACIGLSRYRHQVKAMKIGVFEIIYGLIVVLSLIVGNYAGY